MIGSLMYVTSSRPDILFATCMCARYQANPNEHHVSAIKRIFRYLKGTINLGLRYPKDSGFDLTAYSDVDHAGCHLDRKKWEDDGVDDDDYEEGPVFDDDPYEKRIVSGDVRVNWVFKDELEMEDDVFVLIGEQVEEFVSNGHISKIMSTCAQPHGPLNLMSLHVFGFVPKKVQDFVEGLPYHGDSSDDLVENPRTNFVYPWGNDAGPSVEERALLFLEVQDRVRKKSLFKVS
nr:hypothetical protein [Tanacetum cinerariifolium]